MGLRREIGYYMMDYFLPSILLVCMSWVTFWLQADAAPPRVTLGESRNIISSVLKHIYLKMKYFETFIFQINYEHLPNRDFDDADFHHTEWRIKQKFAESFIH